MAQNVEFILDVNRAVVWFKILTISCYKCKSGIKYSLYLKLVYDSCVLMVGLTG